MRSSAADARVTDAAAVPTGGVLVPVRRLIIAAIVAGIGYSVLSTASRGHCRGGVRATGGFVDALGNPTDVAPSCVVMAVRPSPVAYLALALVVVWAVSRAARLSPDARAAAAILHRAVVAVVVVAVLGVATTQSAFGSSPLDRWDGTGRPPVPGWISIDVTVTPMPGS